MIVTVMPTIVSALSGFEFYGWVFAAFLLAQAVSVPIYGKLADLFGRQRILFAGTGLYVAASFAAGFSVSLPMLIACRVLQGIGSGAILPMATTIIGDIYTPEERARVQGYVAAVWGTSAIVGPSLGALILAFADWHVAFWVNIPVAVVALGMIRIYHRETIEPRQRRIDFLGAALLVPSVSAIMTALMQGATFPAWLTASLALAGGLGIAVFVRYERRVAEPLVPIGLWRDRIIAIGTAGAFLLGILMMGVPAFLPAHIQAVMGEGPRLAAFAVAAQMAGWATCSGLGGVFMLRTSYRFVTIVGSVALIGGAAVLAAVVHSGGTGLLLAGAFLFGLGLGLTHSVFLISVQTSVDWAQRGSATSAVHFGRVFGQAFGATLFGAILNVGLSGVDARRTGAHLVEATIDPARRAAMDEATLARVIAAMADALGSIYWTATAIAVLVLVLGLMLPSGARPGRGATPTKNPRSKLIEQ